MVSAQSSHPDPVDVIIHASQLLRSQLQPPSKHPQAMVSADVQREIREQMAHDRKKLASPADIQRITSRLSRRAPRRIDVG